MDSSPCPSVTRYRAGGRKWLTITRCRLQGRMKRLHPHLRGWRIKTLEKLILKSGWCSCFILIPLWANGSRRPETGRCSLADSKHDCFCRPLLTSSRPCTRFARQIVHSAQCRYVVWERESILLRLHPRFSVDEDRYDHDQYDNATQYNDFIR